MRLYRLISPVAGRIPALMACSLFLFSYDLLRASSHWTGINWSIFWMALGLFFALRQRDILCGIALGFGISTGVYVVPGAMVVMAILFAQRKMSAARCMAAAMLTCMAIHLPFLAAGGKDYPDAVFLYHSLKPSQPGLSFPEQLGNLLFHNFFLLAAPLYVLPVLVIGIHKALRIGTDKPDWRRVFNISQHPFIATGIWCFLGWCGYIVFLSTLSRVYHYYFLLLFPFSAVCAGLFISYLGTRIRSCIRDPYSLVAVSALSLSILAGYFIYPRL